MLLWSRFRLHKLCYKPSKRIYATTKLSLAFLRCVGLSTVCLLPYGKSKALPPHRLRWLDLWYNIPFLNIPPLSKTSSAGSDYLSEQAELVFTNDIGTAVLSFMIMSARLNSICTVYLLKQHHSCQLVRKCHFGH